MTADLPSMNFKIMFRRIHSRSGALKLNEVFSDCNLVCSYVGMENYLSQSGTHTAHHGIIHSFRLVLFRISAEMKGVKNSKPHLLALSLAGLFTVSTASATNPL